MATVREAYIITDKDMAILKAKVERYKYWQDCYFFVLQIIDQRQEFNCITPKQQKWLKEILKNIRAMQERA